VNSSPSGGGQLPVSMSAKPDFSDWVDDKGVSRPRAR
jgi:hypothetical protein